MAIYIVSHKDSPLIKKHPDGYVPLFVGNKQHELSSLLSDSVCDDTFDNIANLNPYFSELTGLYWVWKNCGDEVKGIVHYRRFFVEEQGVPEQDKPIGMAAVSEYLRTYDCIVPVERPLLQNVRKDYARHHVINDLDMVRASIAARYPSNVAIFDDCMAGRYILPYNMIVARGDVYNEYCAWLFPILFDVYKQIDVATRNDYQKRAIGFLSERLLKVWLLASGHSYCMKPINLVESGMKEKISMKIASITSRLATRR
jgi:hypothetical protein